MLGWLLLDSWLLLWLFRVGRWIRLLPLDLEGLLVVDIRDGLLKLLVLRYLPALRGDGTHLWLRDLRRRRFINSWTDSPGDHHRDRCRPLLQVFLLHAFVFELKAQMLAHLVGGELDLHFRNFYEFSGIIPGLKLDCFLLRVPLLLALLPQALAWCRVGVIGLAFGGSGDGCLLNFQRILNSREHLDILGCGIFQLFLSVDQKLVQLLRVKTA